MKIMKSVDAFERTYPMQFGGDAPVVIAKLKELPRTGWVQWGIPNPETVYGHICAIRVLAVEYKVKLKLSDDELQDLLNILEIHDWPEALVGDGVILGDEVDVDTRRVYKESREMEAMENICESLDTGSDILSLYKRYANGSDRIAKLAKQIEKLQAVQKAAEYEKKYNKTGLTKEFKYYTKDLIHESFLKAQMKRIVVVLPIVIVFGTTTLLTL